ncbi:MAG: hypothetical protein J6A05_10525 [Oscillospiraceae bacterium]|nr:hypothetical protein [Oscillospiraceae bacterium]
MSLLDFFKNMFRDEEKEAQAEELLKARATDFYAEADRRLKDKTVIRTSKIHDLDPLEILDKMNLFLDLKNDFVLRRKLKKLFLGFVDEMSDFETYEGGREIEGYDYEEVDDVEMEIYVKISRASDRDPFVVIVAISEFDE